MVHGADETNRGAGMGAQTEYGADSAVHGSEIGPDTAGVGDETDREEGTEANIVREIDDTDRGAGIGAETTPRSSSHRRAITDGWGIVDSPWTSPD